jgi:hypothetical protein
MYLSMGHLSIRDLQKISSEAISALPGMTAIKSGARTVGFLTPLKRADPERLKALLDDIDALAKQRDPKEDDEFLISQGIDPTNWSVEAVEALLAKEG